MRAELCRREADVGQAAIKINELAPLVLRPGDDHQIADVLAIATLVLEMIEDRAATARARRSLRQWPMRTDQMRQFHAPSLPCRTAAGRLLLYEVSVQRGDAQTALPAMARLFDAAALDPIRVRAPALIASKGDRVHDPLSVRRKCVV
jgi:hypothetical protein